MEESRKDFLEESQEFQKGSLKQLLKERTYEGNLEGTSVGNAWKKLVHESHNEPLEEFYQELLGIKGSPELPRNSPDTQCMDLKWTGIICADVDERTRSQHSGYR